MTLEGEGLIESSSFATVQLQSCGGSVPRHSDRVPLSIVDGYCREPYISLFCPKTVQIISEVQSAVFDLKIEQTFHTTR